MNFHENQMQFAGANNPLYIVRSDAIERIKADNKGIGLQKGNFVNKRFTNHVFEMEDNDVYFIFSDGYASQFGGTLGKEKLKLMRFREYLLEASKIDTSQQYRLMHHHLMQWKGDAEQTDDILVMGFKRPTLQS